MSGQNGADHDEMDSDEDGQTIDGATGLPDPTPDRVKLSTLRDIRLEMARVYRSVKRGKLEESAASKRVYMLGEIGKIIRDADLEQRILELEQRHAMHNGGRPALPATQH
jgi:hypothetical protein